MYFHNYMNYIILIVLINDYRGCIEFVRMNGNLLPSIDVCFDLYQTNPLQEDRNR